MTRKNQEITNKEHLEKATERAQRFSSVLNNLYQSQTSKSEKNRIKTEGLPLCIFNESSQLFEINYEYIKGIDN